MLNPTRVRTVGTGALCAVLLVAGLGLACAETTASHLAPATPGDGDREGEPAPEAKGPEGRESAEVAEPSAERVLGDKRFVRRGEAWYLVSGGRLYEVLPDSLSLKFKPEVTAEAQREFLAGRGLALVRRNRLGIYDVRPPSHRHAVDWLADLYGHPLLEFVEVNTKGAYQER